MPTTTSKADRRQIASEFKERKVPQGIFAIRCVAAGLVWVGSSPNLDAAPNSNWFQLRSGVHRNKAMQAAWIQHGESSFLFEVVDQFEEDIAALNLRDHMALKKAEWCEVLQAEALDSEDKSPRLRSRILVDMSSVPKDQTPKATFESWGRYPTYAAKIVPLHWQSDFAPAAEGLHDGALVVGMGRSYGDSCLLKDGNLLVTTGMNRLISFDPETGLLTAEAGITLAQILDFCVPRGFFLPVSPGTKYVTLGGAIANDIHGKNHHVAGTFGCHVTQFELVHSDGTRLLCTPTENPDWFAATIGGLGLTGFISWATLRMKPIVSRMIDYEGIQFHGIDEFLDLTKQSHNIEYTVSWVDCASTGRNFLRGVFMQGDHSTRPAPLKPSPEPKLVFPFDAPGFALNHTTVSLFNTAFFHKQIDQRVVALQDYEPFFYPLDKVLHWNRMYGKSGLLQFQYVIPWEHAREGTIAIMQEVAKSGLASFLAVLKAFGDVPSPGMSFPKPGITLALDFPIKPDKSFPLFERLADMTREFGGRLYPAKDAAMTASQFQTFYPQWEQLARYRDPLLTSSFWERVTGDRLPL